MAKGFDSIKNGVLFGAAFGVLLLYAAVQTESFLGFWASWMDSLVGWLTTQTWFPASLNFTWLNYVFSGLFGAIVGAYIDSR